MPYKINALTAAKNQQINQHNPMAALTNTPAGRRSSPAFNALTQSNQTKAAVTPTA
jgi:hypothetical protein